MQLIQMVAGMRDKCTFQCGEAIKDVAPSSLSARAENPFGDPFEFRPYRLGKKIKAGADFIQTQGIFNIPKFREFMQRCGDLGLLDKVYILAGVIPVKGPAGAKYMRDSVPGMDVPDEVVRVLRRLARASKTKRPRPRRTKSAALTSPWRLSSRCAKSWRGWSAHHGRRVGRGGQDNHGKSPGCCHDR